MQIDDEEQSLEQDSQEEQSGLENTTPEQEPEGVQWYPDGPDDIEPPVHDATDDMVLSADENPPKEYTDGFNNAYLIAAEEPELLEDIVRGLNPSSIYLEGFFAGKDQWKHEQVKDQENELAQLRSRGKDKDREFER
ncbi:MAG: hypothetical protein U9R46_13750 [Bacteroidota bacterium]|nr:hypothetical protein [Bacteroidota bacterium]